MISITTLHSLRRAEDIRALVEADYQSDVEQFLAVLDRSVNAQLGADLGQAKKYLAAVAKLSRLIPAAYRPRVKAMQARYLQGTGDYKRAAQRYESAAAAYRRLRQFDNNARVGRALAEVYMYLGRYDKALVRGRSALAYFRRHDKAGEAARTMVNIGNIYHRRDNNRMALRYYDRARDHFLSVGGPALATVDYNRANILANMNQLREARTLYESAGRAYKKAGMRIPELLAEYSLAYLDFLGGNFSTALARFETVGAQFQAAGDTRSAALTELDLVELNVQINQYGSALLAGRETGERLRQMGLRYEQARAEYFMALAELALGETEAAARRLKQAGRLFQQEGNLLWEGMVKFAHNRLNLAGGRYRQAEKASQEARALFARSGDERRTIDADIAHLQAAARRTNGTGFLQRARRLKRQKLADYQRYRLHHVIGEYHYQRSRPADALKAFRHAIDAIEAMIDDLYQDEIRYFFLVDKYETYARAVACLLALNQTAEAFAQNCHALSILNRRPVSDRELRREVPEGLADSIAELRANLARLSQFPRADFRQGGTVGTFSAIEQKLWAEERRARTYLPIAPARTERTEAGPFQARLPDQTSVVTYFMQENAVGAFVCTNQTTEYVSLPAAPTDLQITVRKLNFLLELGVRRHQATGTAGRQLLQELHAGLIAPLESHLTGDRLLVIPDNFLGQIPFGALAGPSGEVVSDRRQVQVLVDPLALEKSKKPSGRFGNRRSAIFTVPSPSLPSVAEEGDAVHHVYNQAHAYRDTEATCTRLQTELQQATGFVHIATHASRSSENPLFSRLLMSDGPFFPFDLRGRRVKAELVTLSGCQTAAPGLNYGNSFSLAKAFHAAGARFVLASLWPVTDRLTMQFMSEFYAMLKTKRDIPIAYHEATQSLRSQIDDPAVWGAFILIGI